MATPDFVLELREKIGTAPLPLVGVTAIVFRDEKVLLGRRADNGAWQPMRKVLAPDPALLAENARDDAAPALEVLKAALADGDEWVRLQAALALDELGPRARPALGALRAAVNDGASKYVARVANHAVNALTGETNEVT